MTAPADVLASYAQDTGAFRVTKAAAAELAETCAAVAELIEADIEFDSASMDVASYEAVTPYSSRNYRTVCYVRQREAIARRTSALARVRGAA